MATEMGRAVRSARLIGWVSYSGLLRILRRPDAGHSEQIPTGWFDEEAAALPTKAHPGPGPGPCHREALAQLTAALLEQETVTGDQVLALDWASMTTGMNPPLLLNVLVDSAQSVPKGVNTVRHPKNHHRQHQPGRSGRHRRRRSRRRGDYLACQQHARHQPQRHGHRPHRAGDRRRQAPRPSWSEQPGAAAVLLPERHGGEVGRHRGLATLWSPLTSGPPAATGLTGKLAAVMDVHGDQVAYNGHLLYTFADDQAGQVTGQGVQGFFVATPGLTPITGSSAPASTVPAASSGSGYGY